jgi:DNA adenine methylase
MDLVLTPFLKWPGGKRWLIPHLVKIIPQTFNHYYEPFVGSGSVFFWLTPSSATISDINEELINLYVVMRDFPHELAQMLIDHQSKHDKEYYYKIRATNIDESISRAGRLLYLNRTCFNGMYRVNRQGKFNVPIGLKTNCTYDIDQFPLYSAVLKKAEISSGDFSVIIKKAKGQDLIFADPPYTMGNNQDIFTKYNEKLFTWSDQERLLNELVYARDHGSYVISTNASFKGILKMYQDKGFYVYTLGRYCSIAGKVEKRAAVNELLITSYPVDL